MDAHALYPECSLADLYDETVMPAELRRAHQANDLAVMPSLRFCQNDDRERNRGRAFQTLPTSRREIKKWDNQQGVVPFRFKL